MQMSHGGKIGIFTLAMINVAAIACIRNLPMTAEYGLAAVFYVAVAALIFFIPVSLVAAELATGWPKRGGIYLWVKEAFGPRWGFLAIWLQWIENVIWFPTVLAFTAGTLAYVFNPALAENKFYALAVILIVFWGCTFLNFFGMRTSGFISTAGAILGTIIPGAFIILLGVIWIASGKPTQISFDLPSLIPDMSKISNLTLLAGVLLALAGMEMSAVHAMEVKNPKKDYPKAILLSATIIVVLIALGALSIAIVVPAQKISLVGGVMEAFEDFFLSYNLKWLMPIVAVLTATGAVAMVSTWVIGPAKGLLATAENGDIPPLFQKTNRHGVPVALLLLQAFALTALSMVFLYMPTVSSSYWLLTALTVHLYLIMYLLMFLSAIRLRYSQPHVIRPYHVPGGKFGIWLVGGMGILGALFAISIGYIPPSQLPTGNEIFYEIFLVAGTLFFCALPLVIYEFRRPKWVHKRG